MEDSKDFHPATKEQRDTLLKAMVDAGYKWDSENKILLSLKAEPNSEQKTAGWSEEDEKMLDDAYIMLDWYKGNNWWTAQHIKNWLKSIKQRIWWKPTKEQSEKEPIINVPSRNGMYICDKCSFPISQQDEYELVAKRIEQKTAWSEEDEYRLKSCLSILEPKTLTGTIKTINSKWLRSLKERIK